MHALLAVPLAGMERKSEQLGERRRERREIAPSKAFEYDRRGALKRSG